MDERAEGVRELVDGLVPNAGRLEAPVALTLHA